MTKFSKLFVKSVLVMLNINRLAIGVVPGAIDGALVGATEGDWEEA
jgi:hypothetical protein